MSEASTSSQTDITALCHACGLGDESAMNQLFELLYDELQTIARANRRRWQGNQTLNTTALIHETYLKLVGGSAKDLSGRSHFYATAAKAMRHVLVNYAQRQSAMKRGGAVAHTDRLDEVAGSGHSLPELMALHQALEQLEGANPRRSAVVECRIFGGMTNEEVGAALGISIATVKREWSLAQAELYQHLSTTAEPTPTQNR